MRHIHRTVFLTRFITRTKPLHHQCRVSDPESGSPEPGQVPDYVQPAAVHHVEPAKALHPIQGRLRHVFRTSKRKIRYVGEKYAQNGLRLPPTGTGGQVEFGVLSAAGKKSAING